jgi:hypothetical protein
MGSSVRRVWQLGVPSLLREAEVNYSPVFGVENRAIRPKNVHFWYVFC